MFSIWFVLLSCKWLLRSDALQNRIIVGGYPIAITEAPYTGSLHLFGIFVCGLSIISKEWVISAAHCATFRPKHYLVHYGSPFTTSGGNFVDITRVIIHPSYNFSEDGGIFNDIALIKLAEEIDVKIGKPIQLPEQDEPIAEYTICLITGWGSTEPSRQKKHLLGANVPIWSNKKCQVALNYPIMDSNVCAGNPAGGVGTCQGDSGGPLQCNNKLVGITSAGNGCARPNSPAISTRVVSYRNWIKEQTRI